MSASGFSGLAGLHYPLVDPTLALDLQARLQAMYAGVYHPWRYFGCGPLITNDQSSVSPTSFISMKSSPSTSLKNSPTSPSLLDNFESSTTSSIGKPKSGSNNII